MGEDFDGVFAAQRKDFRHVAFAIEDLDFAGQSVAHLHGVDHRLDEAAVVDVVGEHPFTGKFKALICFANGSNFEIEGHVFKRTAVFVGMQQLFSWLVLRLRWRRSPGIA